MPLELKVGLHADLQIGHGEDELDPPQLGSTDLPFQAARALAHRLGQRRSELTAQENLVYWINLLEWGPTLDGCELKSLVGTPWVPSSCLRFVGGGQVNAWFDRQPPSLRLYVPKNLSGFWRTYAEQRPFS